MNWIIDNWMMLIVMVCFVVITVTYLRQFADEPLEEQERIIKEWLLIAVTKCEAELGSKTGALKLSLCYDMFVKAFPSLVSVIPFETFSRLVDEVLVEMKEILKTQPEVLQKVAQ